MNDSARSSGRLRQTERVKADSPGPSAMIAQKAIRFVPSARRMLQQLGPERPQLAAVVGLALASMALTAAAPIILARATDLVFAGVFGRQFQTGLTRDDAIASLRADGSATADMVAAMEHLVPGQGVDLSAVAVVLLLALGVYVTSGLLSWLQGYLLNEVVQATVRRLRNEVEGKIHRLP